MTNDEYTARNISLIRKMIKKWDNGTVQVWQYTVSHKTLVLRVTKPGEYGNLHISCSDVSFISCATTWNKLDLQVNIKMDDNKEERYHIIDKNKSYFIDCGLIDVMENVKPVYKG